jgi:hypothetical protein
MECGELKRQTWATIFFVMLASFGTVAFGGTSGDFGEVEEPIESADQLKAPDTPAPLPQASEKPTGRMTVIQPKIESNQSSRTSINSKNRTSLSCSYPALYSEARFQVFIDQKAHKLWYQDVFGIDVYELYRTPDERRDWGERIFEHYSRRNGIDCYEWMSRFSIDRHSLRVELKNGPLCIDPSTGERVWMREKPYSRGKEGSCSISQYDYSHLARPTF